MTDTGRGGTPAIAPKRVTFLELFFDLVFVFAITQLAKTLHADHSLAGWGRAGILAWLIWWAWSQYTWAGNAVDLDRRGVRTVMLAVTGAALFAGIGLPGAFEGDGAWFALPYAAVRLTGLALYWHGLRGAREHQAALRTYLPAAVVPVLLVLVGGVLDTDQRIWWWTAAVVVDVTSALLAGRGEFRVEPAHFAERHGLFVIIALGESVIATGITATSAERTPELVVVVAAGAVVIGTMWWAYFDRINAAAEHRLVAEVDHRRRGRTARDLFTFLHLPIVLGPVVFAVGVEEAIAHPAEPLDAFGRWATAGGIALFLGGFLLGNARATGRLLVERAVGLAAIAAVGALVAPTVDGWVTVVLLAVILAAVDTVETLRRPDRRVDPAPAGSVVAG